MLCRVGTMTLQPAQRDGPKAALWTAVQRTRDLSDVSHVIVSPTGISHVGVAHSETLVGPCL